jgi:hypothetical protein
MRLLVIVGSLVVLSACNESGPRTITAPTPVAPAPPPVVVTPPAPPPAPTITNYAGRWTGEYVVVQCAGSSGSMDDVLCSAPRPGNAGGIFQRDARFPITIELSQSGSAVNGALSLGLIRGTVNGSVLSQRLILSGTMIYSDGATGLTLTNVITQWDSSIVSDILTGDFSLNVRLNVLPGDAVVRLRLQNTMRR